MPESPCVFISYAHRDGGGLAVRLQGDLEARGFDVWLDRFRLKGGDRWTNETEGALDRAEVVIALLSDGSFSSDTCRAEQGTALDAGKRIIPVKVQSNCEVQLRLRELQSLDFSDLTIYAERFQELLQSIGQRRRVVARPAAGPRYNNAPPLPANFVDRPELLTRLRDALFQDLPNRNIALTALQGMGGIGKTVLAQALCRQAVVQHAFPDGIFWFTIGKESRLGFDQRIQAVPGLNQLLGAWQGEEACVNQYRNTLHDKAALIVLDDVWRAADIAPFQTESPRSRLLITTRDAGIARFSGAREHKVELLDAPQSRELLALWADLEAAQLPSAADDILRECDRLPLALSTVGALLRGAAPAEWADTAELLHHADLAEIEEQLPPGQQSFFRAIDVSVKALEPEMQQRYGKLAVLLEDMPAALPVLETLWNCDDAEARRIGRRLADRSLAQRDAQRDGESGIRLHDLQLDYVRAQYADREALGLIHSAVRLSAHVIEKDPRQFASQVVGRLLPHRSVPAIQPFIDEITVGAPAPWLRLIHPALHPPGTPLLRTLEGHSDYVSGVAVTRDGKRAVSASLDNTLKVWDLDTSRVPRTLEGHSAYVYGVAVTPEGKRAVSASGDNTLKVWDLDTGHALRTLEGHAASVYGVAVTPDGKRAVSASLDNTLKLWNLDTGHALRTLEGHAAYVYGVAVTPDGKLAVSASWDHTLKVWDIAEAAPQHYIGHALRTLEGHSGYVSGVAVTPDGKRAVSTSGDNTLKVWDLDTGRALRTLEGHSDSVRGVAATPDGKRVVSASWDNTLKVWDIAAAAPAHDTRRAPRVLEGHSDYVYGVAVTPDGKRAVSASRDNTLKVWDLDTGRAPLALEGHSACVYGVAVAPDGKRAVSASRDNTLRVWDLDTGRALFALEGHSASVYGVAVTLDGKRAVSASGDHTLKVWDLDTGRTLLTLEGHPAAVYGVAVTPDGKRAVSASRDRTLKVWELDPGAAERAKVWSLDAGGAERTLEGHSADVYGVALTPDGKRAVSASGDHTLKVWDMAEATPQRDTSRALRTLQGHSGSVEGVAVTPDGKRVVSASGDNTLKVWDLETGLLIATFHCDAPARCCAFADERRIVAGDEGGRVYILSLVLP